MAAAVALGTIILAQGFDDPSVSDDAVQSPTPAPTEVPTGGDDSGSTDVGDSDDGSVDTDADATDGTSHYLKHRLPGVLNFSASPVGAADRIYLLSERGRMVVLKRGPSLKVLALNELDGTFYASPAIVGDAIYIRSDKHLFCFAKASN